MDPTESCFLCLNVKVKALSGPNLVKHMGAHILHDYRLKNSNSPCGFCLSTSGYCTILLTRGRGRNGEQVINVKESKCPNLRKFTLKTASTHTEQQPCTNHPLHCPLCQAVVWKYNLHAHIINSHPTSNAELYKSQYGLHDNELTLMRAVFLTPTRQSKKKSKNGNLVISETHSSQMALWYDLGCLR